MSLRTIKQTVSASLFTAIASVSISSVSSAARTWNDVSIQVQQGKVETLNRTAQVHYEVYRPTAPVADVLYIHGYGSRANAHTGLFREWTDAGFRVIALDLPSHGETDNLPMKDLNSLNFEELSTIIADVEAATIEETERPLILSGWSLGGLIATRIVQSPRMFSLSRTPSGLVLFTPGVSVYPCVGNLTCHITNQTLTHDRTLFNRPISPRSPMYRPLFGIRLIGNLWHSWQEALPASIPTFVLVAGDKEDVYARSTGIKKWVGYQKRKYKADIAGVQCRNAKHEIDNELPEFGGKQSRVLSAKVMLQMIGRLPKGSLVQPGEPCQPL